MLLHPAWWTCAVDSKTVGLVVTTLFSESNVVWCVVCCAESQCWFALKGTWSAYIYTFDPKTVDLYKYIPLIPRLWIWTSSISKLVAVASAVVGIDQYSYAFDPETVDLYKYLWSQDCGSFKLELSSEYGIVSCFLYWLSKLTWYEIMPGRGLMNSLYKSPHSFHLIRKKELPPEYPVTS